MNVNWSAYAWQYDLMAESNPAYQELLAHCLSIVTQWPLPAGGTIADFGAGTGNFSIALARALPALSVLHLEFDPGMLAIAENKARQAKLSNWHAIRLDLDASNWSLPALAGAVTIHCLYATKHPKQVIQRICSALTQGGHLYACDIGRVMDVPDWARYIIGSCFRARGLWPTISLLLRSGNIRRQNRLVAQAQRAGKYWTHGLGEFRACFETRGITVTHTSQELYRGYDDLVVGQKQNRPMLTS
jgi:ubiquinone/menaquinone biosynthesis C-methylase UbiE